MKLFSCSGEAYAEEMPPGGPGSVVEDGLQRGAFGGWVSGGASVRGLRHAGPSMGLPPPPQVKYHGLTSTFS